MEISVLEDIVEMMKLLIGVIGGDFKIDNV